LAFLKIKEKFSNSFSKTEIKFVPFYLVSIVVIYIFKYQEMCGSDLMVAGFTTTCAISAHEL
jgi:branched-subunit amino acid transport protein AzlD